MTLSGVSKAERRKRAKEALEQVGLGSQLKKKPSGMSGGQMQRVAIARAIVNNPDIILADEPTGALDTDTSVQVMDILKELSKDRLVIMVTHNPELADKYATRIIRMLDGEITDDSAPLTGEEKNLEKIKEKAKAENSGKKRMPSMSFATSFSLSLKNLFTKKGRTILTSFAGSIGIIGIALIFAVSQGMTAYIDTIQEDALSSYPLTLEAQSVDLLSMMQVFMDTSVAEKEHENDRVYAKGMIYDLVDALNNTETTENDLASFKKYLETELEKDTENNKLRDAISGIQYTYGLDLLVYTENVDGNIIRSDTETLMMDLIMKYMGMDMTSMSGMQEMIPGGGGMTSAIPMQGNPMNLWQEMIPGEDGKLVSPLLEKQYEVVYGSWPTEYNEIVLVLDENNELDDLTLYALGLKSEDDMAAIMDAAQNGSELEADTQSWTYEEICNMEFRTVLNSDRYVLDENTGFYTDLSETDTGMRYLYDNAMTLKVSGIIRPNGDAMSAMLSGSIAYTNELTEYVIEHSSDSEAVQAQMKQPGTDIFTGLPFNENIGALSDSEKESEFRSYVDELNESEKDQTYMRIMSIPTEEQLEAAVSQAMAGMTWEDMEKTMLQAMTQQMGVSESDIQNYTASMSDEELSELFSQMIGEQVKAQFAAQVQEQMGGMMPSQLSGALMEAMKSYTSSQCAVYYDEIIEFSDSCYEDNLDLLGCIDLESPASINLYASSFADKDVIEDVIAGYNESVDELSEIKYTDYVGLMMSTVTTIIDAITYVLIAFVAISLIVSSIMIGVITLISVQERTKEIGILRAIGASKANVSSMFNAETVIIGFTSGALGVVITYLLCIPINAVIQALTGINNLSATLPVPIAIILVVISMALTVFAGIIPSRSAAKKDPVVALRTE